ncbi:hypothetical protein F5Y09DRAFT_348073 [Xylaria sp. FL1042]|nr:hypothetical protein F5Y09DRAFT_348073 [Xylaria sp. FL1042]
MKLIQFSLGMGVVKVAVLSSATIHGNLHLVSPTISQASSAIDPPLSDANATDCQAALDQLWPFEDQNFEVYSSICLNWSQDTCNIRFCAQPYITKSVNRTASWIYRWANDSLMECTQGGQYAVMGDSANLNGNGGTYRLHIEHAEPRHG